MRYAPINAASVSAINVIILEVNVLSSAELFVPVDKAKLELR